MAFELTDESVSLAVSGAFSVIIKLQKITLGNFIKRLNYYPLITTLLRRVGSCGSLASSSSLAMALGKVSL